MAHCKLTPQEFIRNAFCPLVAVSSSPSSEAICRKNNLSFIELLQPFCKLGSEAHYKDPTGTVTTIRNFKIVMLDINFRPPQPTLARKFLNTSVSQAQESKPHTVVIGTEPLDIPTAVPWFEAWRETFLQVQFPSDHEFTKHFLACAMVVASNEENPIERMQQMNQSLNQMQSVTPTKLPKWFNGNILRYYVVLHDRLEGNEDSAVTAFDSFRASYGSNNCFLLQINSRPPGKHDEQLPDPWSQFLFSKIAVMDMNNSMMTPDCSPSFPTATGLEIGQEASEAGTNSVLQAYHPLSPDNDDLNMSQSLADSDLQVGITSTAPVYHGSCLSTEDVEQLKLLIHEFCTRSLLPYIELQVQQLSDLVSNKKGVSRSFISATKRWFAPNKPGSGTAVPVNTLIYAGDAPELQMRRLGDLYFMFGHYGLAFQAYHSAKRDFHTDQAWLYYAGALEMASLAAFMNNEPTRKTFDYMDEGIATYLNTCKVGQFATRATLLSTECLKGRNMFGEAAHQLIRMTSEESDLRSALLLEQAAYCFLLCTKPHMIRKYAFHMVLAGHRFSKAAQRKHSLRCYKQAFQVYENKGWNLADDHIYYTLGRQASNLKLLDEATYSYSKLLTEESKQTAQQQGLFLKEYIITHNLLAKDSDNSFLPILPLPLIDGELTKVLVGPRLPLRTPGKIFASGITLASHDDISTTQRWHKLEELVVQEAQGSIPMIMKPIVTLFSNENISAGNPMAIIGEPVQVSIEIHNPLQITLNLKDIYLMWRFVSSNSSLVITNEMDTNTDSYLKTHRLKSCILQPSCKQELILSVTPLVEGNIVIQGVCYSLCNTISNEEQVTVKGKQLLVIKGPKLKRKEKPGAVEIKPDGRLDIKVIPPASCLEVSFCEINTELLCNELQQIVMEFKNVGNIPLHNIHMATSVPHLLSSCEFKGEQKQYLNIDSQNRKNHVTNVPLSDKKLEHGRSLNISIWLKAPEVKGPMLVDLLVYYENYDGNVLPKYRLVRHTWQLSIQDSLQAEVSTHRSGNSKAVEEMTLSVVATNMNQVHHAVLTEISVLQASLRSSTWSLLKQHVCPNVIKLTSQESVHLLLRGQRRQANTKELYSEVSFCQHQRLTRESQKAYMDFVIRSDTGRCTIFDMIDDAGTRNVESKEATLILRWHALVTDSAGNKRSIVGQNHIPVEKFNRDSKVSKEINSAGVLFDRLPEPELSKATPSMSSLQRQISYNLLHPAKLVHNFVTNKLCTVAVQLLLHSCSDNSLVVSIKTLGSRKDGSGQSRPALFYPYSSRHFCWIGTSGLMRTVPPLKSISVSLSVAVLSPGTYDLGSRLEVWCHRNEQPNFPVLQICRLQSALIVACESSSNVQV